MVEWKPKPTAKPAPTAAEAPGLALAALTLGSTASSAWVPAWVAANCWNGMLRHVRWSVDLGNFGPISADQESWCHLLLLACLHLLITVWMLTWTQFMCQAVPQVAAAYCCPPYFEPEHPLLPLDDGAPSSTDEHLRSKLDALWKAACWPGDQWPEMSVELSVGDVPYRVVVCRWLALLRA